MSRVGHLHGCGRTLYPEHKPPGPCGEVGLCGTCWARAEVVPRSEAEALAGALEASLSSISRTDRASYRRLLRAATNYRSRHPKECTQLARGYCEAECPTCDEPREETP